MSDTAQNIRAILRTLPEIGRVVLTVPFAYKIATELDTLILNLLNAEQEVKDLKAKLEKVEATAKRRLELVRRCEWSGHIGCTVCPICRGWHNMENHKPTCPLAAELKEAHD